MSLETFEDAVELFDRLCEDPGKVIRIKPSSECPHCKFLAELFKDDEIESNREY